MKKIIESRKQQIEADKKASKAIINETGIFEESATADASGVFNPGERIEVPLEYLPKSDTIKALFTHEDGEQFKIEITREEGIAFLDGLKKIFE